MRLIASHSVRARSACPSRLAPAVAAVAAFIGSLAMGCGSSSTDSAGGAAAGAGGAGAGGAAGSGGAAGTGGTSLPDAGGCGAMLESCLVSQRTCVDDGSGPVCKSCPTGQYAAKSGACEAIAGTKVSHDFPDFTVDASQEILASCESWTMNNPTELWVNAVELTQDAASHHSNWMYVPDDKYPGPDGVWKCKDRGYSEVDAALSGGVLYAQSTQATREVQKFPNGAAFRIPPYSKILSGVHLLNSSDKPVTGHLSLTIYSLSAADVSVKLAPFNMAYADLTIPPHATSRFTGDCNDLESQWQSIAKAPLEAKVYYALPHTHALGSRFFMNVSGGPNDGQTIMDIDGYDGEAHGRAYDPPFDLTGANGLSFGCEFINPRAKEVNWGFGDQEMCEMLGYMESPLGFQSAVNVGAPAGDDGAVKTYTGKCATRGFFWDNDNKPGGKGPDGGSP